MKAVIKHINTHTQTERIELPDVVSTGDIICAISDAMEKFDYDDCMDQDIFTIALEDGRMFYCLESPDVFNKWRLYVQEPGCDYELVADFRF